MENFRKSLRHAVVTRFGVKGAFDDDTALFSSGLIDSLSVMDLVFFVEAEANFEVPPAEITLDNFDSVNRIVRFIESLASAGKGT